MEPETLSRCETGANPIGPASEKLLRLFLFKTAIKHHKIKDCEAKDKLSQAMDDLFGILKPVAVYDVNDPLVFHFYRRADDGTAGNDNQPLDEEGWDFPKAAASF